MNEYERAIIDAALDWARTQGRDRHLLIGTSRRLADAVHDFKMHNLEQLSDLDFGTRG